MIGLKIEEGVVVNAAIFQDENSLFEDWIPAPEGVAMGFTDNGDGSFSPPVTSEQVISTKEVRDRQLDALTYDFGDGRVIQVRPKDESNIRNAIEIMTAQSIPSLRWVMVDNVKHDVTLGELQDALLAGQLAALEVWGEYEPE